MNKPYEPHLAHALVCINDAQQKLEGVTNPELRKELRQTLEDAKKHILSYGMEREKEIVGGKGR